MWKKEDDRTYKLYNAVDLVDPGDVRFIYSNRCDAKILAVINVVEGPQSYDIKLYHRGVKVMEGRLHQSYIDDVTILDKQSRLTVRNITHEILV